MPRKKPTPVPYPETTSARVPMSMLHLDEGNPNTHDRASIEAIKTSLDEFGQVEPLVVSESSLKVIGGNGRLVAMRELGWTFVNVNLFKGTPSQEKALGIALNRLPELSRRDETILAGLLDELRNESTPIYPPGYDESSVSSLLERLADDAVGSRAVRGDVGGAGDGESTGDGRGGHSEDARGSRRNANPVTVILTDSQLMVWGQMKNEANIPGDTEAFLHFTEIE